MRFLVDANLPRSVLGLLQGFGHFAEHVNFVKYDATMNKIYYLILADETRGPYSLEELKALHATHAISEQTLWSMENGKSWVPLSELPGFISIPVQPPPVPVIPVQRIKPLAMLAPV